MAITREMVLLRMEDIEAFAEARSLVRLARDLASRATETTRPLLSAIHMASSGVAAALAEALRAGEPHTEVRRLRDATLALADLRAQAWDALGAGAIDVPRFDQIMTASSRCRREAEQLEIAVRRRARRKLELGQ